LEKEEREKALKDLNDIQYTLFEDSMVLYEKRRMEAFWNDIAGLELLFRLSNAILEEDLMNSAA
jgi:hypothetical protein